MSASRLLLLVIFGLLTTLPARATLLGAEVGCQFLPSQCDPNSAIVNNGPDPEFTLFTTLTTGARFDLFDVDVSDSEIQIISLFNGGITAGVSFFFDDLIWTDDPTGVISGVSLITTNANLGPANLSFTDHSVRLTHLTTTSYSLGETVTLQLDTDHGGNVGVVPVPAAVWLFGSALLGLAGFARRRKAG